jgi:hypothetical protein
MMQAADGTRFQLHDYEEALGRVDGGRRDEEDMIKMDLGRWGWWRSR